MDNREQMSLRGDLIWKSCVEAMGNCLLDSEDFRTSGEVGMGMTQEGAHTVLIDVLRASMLLICEDGADEDMFDDDVTAYVNEKIARSAQIPE